MVVWPPIRSSWKRFPFYLRAALATLPVLAITLYLYFESRRFERQLLEAETTREADYISLQLQSFLTERISVLRSVGSFELADPAGSRRDEFPRFVKRLVADVPDFAAIDWIDAAGDAHPQIPHPRTVTTLPDLSGPAFGPLRAKAFSSRQPTASGSFGLGPGEQGLAIFVPVFHDGGFDGTVAGTVRLTRGLRALYGRDVLDFWNVELKDRLDRVSFMSLGTGSVGEPAPSIYVAPPRFVPVADHAWKLRLWPTPLLTATLRTGAPPRLLSIGLVATFVVALANYLLAQRQARLRESLQESERLTADVETTRRHLSDLVNGIEAVIWESDADIHRFTFVNDYARKLLGIDTERWVAEPAFWFDHVHPDDRARAREHARAARRPGQTYAAEYRMVDAAERVLWVREIITVIGGPGDSIGRRGVVVDISERVQAEEAVRQSQKLESLGVLAGGIAHDFNNLLTTILGNAEMLGPFLRGGGGESPARGYLDKIERTTRRLAELTRQMLAYSGHGQLSVERLDLNLIITDMAELLTVSTPKNVQVSYALDPHLPPLEADAVQMRQTILNLLTNAAEAIGEHGPGQVTIRTAAETLDAATEDLYPGQELVPGEYVRLEVSDNGCGMSQETLSKIFDPFFTTKFTGRGLGLAALRGIVRGHRGGIRIASQPGEGTTFTLLFPGVRRTAAGARAPGPSAGRGTARRGGNGRVARRRRGRIALADGSGVTRRGQPGVPGRRRRGGTRTILAARARDRRRGARPDHAPARRRGCFPPHPRGAAGDVRDPEFGLHGGRHQPPVRGPGVVGVHRKTVHAVGTHRENPFRAGGGRPRRRARGGVGRRGWGSKNAARWGIVRSIQHETTP